MVQPVSGGNSHRFTNVASTATAMIVMNTHHSRPPTDVA